MIAPGTSFSGPPSPRHGESPCDVFIHERRPDGEYVGECECGRQLRTYQWNKIEKIWFEHAGTIRNHPFERSR